MAFLVMSLLLWSAVETYGIIENHQFKKELFKMLNQKEQALISQLNDSFTRYTTNQGTVLAAATAAIAAAKEEHGLDSDEFYLALTKQVGIINDAADHLQDFTVAPSSPEVPIPVIPEAVIAAPLNIAVAGNVSMAQVATDDNADNATDSTTPDNQSDR